MNVYPELYRKGFRYVNSSGLIELRVYSFEFRSDLLFWWDDTLHCYENTL